MVETPNRVYNLVSTGFITPDHLEKSTIQSREYGKSNIILLAVMKITNKAGFKKRQSKEKNARELEEIWLEFLKKFCYAGKRYVFIIWLYRPNTDQIHSQTSSFQTRIHFADDALQHFPLLFAQCNT